MARRRRRRGTGSVGQRLDGTWEARLPRRDGRASTYWPTRSAAEAWLAGRLKDRDRGVRLSAGRDCLSDHLRGWVARRGDLDDWAPSTRRAYRWAIARLDGALGSCRLAECRRDVVEDLMPRATDGLSRASAALVRSVARQVFTDLVELGLLAVVPLARVRQSRATRERVARVAWRDGDALAFLAAASSDPLAGLWWLAVSRGPRIGELCAITARDLLPAGVLIRETKTRSPRTVDLPASVRGLLVQLAGRVGLAGPLAGCGPAAMRARLAGLCRRAGVPVLRPHDLRHWAASWMLANGAPVAWVSAQLGHAGPGVTWRVYAHVVPSRDVGRVQTFDQWAGGSDVAPVVAEVPSG